MDDSRFSISAPELYSRLGTVAAPIVIDGRRGPAFAANEWMVAGAVHNLTAGARL
jgi:hypothetical protein